MSTHNPSNTPVLPQCELADAPNPKCLWGVDSARNVRCFDEHGKGTIWVKVDVSAPESRVDIYDGIKKWERSV